EALSGTFHASKPEVLFERLTDTGFIPGTMSLRQAVASARPMSRPIGHISEVSNARFAHAQVRAQSTFSPPLPPSQLLESKIRARSSARIERWSPDTKTGYFQQIHSSFIQLKTRFLSVCSLTVSIDCKFG